MLEKDRIIKTPSECSEGVALSIGYGIDRLLIKRSHRGNCSIENGNFLQNLAKSGNTCISASGKFSLISKSGQSDSKIETLSDVKTDVNDVNNYTMYCSAENSSSYPPLPRCHKSHICRIS